MQGKPACENPRMETTDAAEQRELILAVRSALSVLRLTRCQDEDVSVAMLRLDHWLGTHDRRWIK